MHIKQIHAREILDSRGNPTLEATVILENGAMASASVPSGASTGRREAVELRDRESPRYHGKGVLKRVQQIETIIQPALTGKNALDQAMIDQHLIALDGTENKSYLGANALLAVSLALKKVVAYSQHIPLYATLCDQTVPTLPIPFMNIINGGAHANNALDFQEFMIVPTGFDCFSEALRAGVEVFQTLRTELQQKHYSTAVGDEGGFAPSLTTAQEALDCLLSSIKTAGYEPGKHFYLALDIAASELFHEGLYHLPSEGLKLNHKTFCEYLKKLVANYPIISIEDAMAEDDWKGWQHLTEQLGDSIQLVGDDLFVTQTRYLQKGIEEKVANAILIKPNQVGTLTETLSAIQLAKTQRYGVMISHRSGETEDTFIADLAVGTGAGQIKTGSLCRGERIAKYNRLLAIEAELGSQATYFDYNKRE